MVVCVYVCLRSVVQFCYVMNTWIPFYNIQMANNLMKWWRTKFLSGYKQFSVDCNEALVSDTEELLASTENEPRPTCTTPPYVPSKEEPPQQLNLEEFSCDVSVEGGQDKSGQERQEFSFTLYDFDGHGKITKDDIAGLVTTIYEVLGSSVKVPHYGSKTIRVKLTVSPDQRKHVRATVIDKEAKRKCRKVKTKHRCCAHEDSEDESEVCSRVSTSADEEGESRYVKPRKVKKRSSSVQRQELLEIIQANMDKNLGFQTVEKPYVKLEQPKPRRKSSKKQSFRCLANMVDPTNFYVDLAALQNSTRLPMSNCQYNKLINAVMCVSNKRVQTRTCHESPQKKNYKKSPQVVVGHTSSPHHLRHRNRQEDQARAMAQVVHWLEQEFSSNVREEEKTKSSEQEKHSSGNSNSGVERHEHHHVHEHVHHHYHHYEDTPVVV